MPTPLPPNPPNRTRPLSEPPAQPTSTPAAPRQKQSSTDAHSPVKDTAAGDKPTPLKGATRGR